MELTPSLILLAGTIIVGVPGVVLIHEAGHALMAVAVGFRVYRIELGIEKRLAQFEVGGTLITFGRRLGGRVWSAPRQLEGWRWRKVLITLAGPVASALAGGATLWVGLASAYPFSVRVAIGMFGGLNLVELLNLIPYGQRKNDGQNLLLALRCSPDKAGEFASKALAHEIEQLLERESPLALIRAREFLALTPDRPEAALLLGLTLTRSGEFRDGHRYLQEGLELLSRSDLPADRIAEVRSQVMPIVVECEAALARANGD